MDSRLRQLADVLFVQADKGALNPVMITANLLPHVFILDVERDAAKQALRLRVRLTGTAIDGILGRATSGHALEEFIHGPRGDEVLAGFHHCANTREPLWMRQVVQIKGKVARFVEGITIYLPPERICGGLVAGELPAQSTSSSFERDVLFREN
jgi:hypothetical protein